MSLPLPLLFIRFCPQSNLFALPLLYSVYRRQLSATFFTFQRSSCERSVTMLFNHSESTLIQRTTTFHLPPLFRWPISFFFYKSIVLIVSSTDHFNKYLCSSLPFQFISLLFLLFYIPWEGNHRSHLSIFFSNHLHFP